MYLQKYVLDNLRLNPNNFGVTPMSIPTSSNNYAQTFGTSSSTVPFISNVDPTPSNITGPSGPFKLGQVWVNTVGNTVWELTSFSTVSGNLTATWTVLGISSGALSTLTGNVGGAVSPVAGNINVQGTPTGAIVFSNGGAGLLSSAVQVDNTTITVNGSNQLAAANTLTGTVTTVGAVTSPVVTIPLGGTPGTYTLDITVAGFATVGGPLGAGYTLVGAVRTTGGAAVLLPNQALDDFEEGALSAGNCQIAVSGNNAVIEVTGTAGKTINWSAIVRFIFVS